MLFVSRRTRHRDESVEKSATDRAAGTSGKEFQHSIVQPLAKQTCAERNENGARQSDGLFRWRSLAYAYVGKASSYLEESSVDL